MTATPQPNLDLLARRHAIVADAAWKCRGCGFSLTPEGGHFVHSQREIQRVRETAPVGFPR